MEYVSIKQIKDITAKKLKFWLDFIFELEMCLFPSAYCISHSIFSGEIEKKNYRQIFSLWQHVSLETNVQDDLLLNHIIVIFNSSCTNHNVFYNYIHYTKHGLFLHSVKLKTGKKLCF